MPCRHTSPLTLYDDYQNNSKVLLHCKRAQFALRIVFFRNAVYGILTSCLNIKQLVAILFYRFQMFLLYRSPYFIAYALFFYISILN